MKVIHQLDAPSPLKFREGGRDSPLPLYSLTVQSPKNTYTRLGGWEACRKFFIKDSGKTAEGKDNTGEGHLRFLIT